ncbi:hypothetical protein [Geomicrobium sediminis]|uniref:PIN domain-containing protein n=1 Tax=Geomicrobium sediminis TaxID=1347788 RepID=A0ABS2P6J1_9BACL|nr:hypothetical protein [Geomicrobium sediminis]MBM7631024.1 hypothetical protein [Geomicrobium sediminis]
MEPSKVHEAVIIAPAELNFLVYCHKIINNKSFPFLNHIHMDMIQKASALEVIRIEWDAVCSQIAKRNEYVMESHYIYAAATRIFPGCRDESVQEVIQSFEAFWFHLPGFGYQSVLETLMVAAIDRIALYTNTYNVIIALFDEPHFIETRKVGRFGEIVPITSYL